MHGSSLRCGLTVDAAVAKGADYLIAEGPSFNPPCEIAQCFGRVEEWSGRELLVKDHHASDDVLLKRRIENLLTRANAAMREEEEA